MQGSSCKARVKASRRAELPRIAGPRAGSDDEVQNRASSSRADDYALVSMAISPITLSPPDFCPRRPPMTRGTCRGHASLASQA
eukprot:2012825-Pyramimonas_sp.AAC.1